MRKLWVATIVAVATGCVTTGKFNEQVSMTEAERQRADDAQRQLADTRSQLDNANKEIAEQKAAIAAAQQEEQNLQAKIKADDDQIASLQKSNKDLSASLEASKNGLRQQVADLIKEKDALQQKLSYLQATTDAQIASLNKKLADIQAQHDAEIAKVKSSYESVTDSLKSEIAQGAVQIQELKGKLTLNLVDKVLFSSGEATINEDGRRVLDHIGDVLNKVMDKDIRIAGYTDDQQIRGELTRKFATNWELSTARATAVARYLQDKDNVDPKRLVVEGYGEYRPIAPNDTPENRALNRRIEIVLVPKE